jgi:peptidoglycan/xylan/chitin deacetylase (PgdA/CDA1 family)
MIKYFNKSRNLSHGIMFHHFHDFKNFKKTQGSISKNQFIKIIKFIGKKNVINADEYIYKLQNKKLKSNEVCLTFDDGLKCHFDIILPLLSSLKIKAFFFIYTSIFEDKPDLLEVFRYFRTSYYNRIDDFYSEFFIFCLKNNIDYLKVNKIEKKNILKKKKIFPFYSNNDILFRILRDKYLTKDLYEEMMIEIMKSKNFDYKKIIKKLYMSPNQISKLSKAGHIIGLHSHSHPTKITNLSYKEQKLEFLKNKKILIKVIKKKIISMSHPCGSYNQNIKKILKILNIQIGFRSNLKTKHRTSKKNYSPLEIAREDHANIIPNIK